MKIYHTETQDDFDALMHELEKEGFKPYSRGVFERYDGDCCIDTEKETELGHCDLSWYKKNYPLYVIEKYTMKATDDVVNNPAHYTTGELEVIDILQDKLSKEEFEGFLKGNILKYTFREGIKNGTEDVKKAAWYTARLIQFRGKLDEAAKQV